MHEQVSPSSPEIICQAKYGDLLSLHSGTEEEVPHITSLGMQTVKWEELFEGLPDEITEDGNEKRR